MNEPCGCCEAPAPPTPEEITNRPGLSAIAYRVGTYATFRQAMLTAISQVEIEEGGKPLGVWTARQSEDYGITLLEMWAYLADILTFYQERIANEVYLRTALQRASVIRLADLIGYKLAGGVAAKTYLAYTLDKGASVKITPRLRVQSVPAQGETAQKFETVETLSGLALLNSLRIYPAPQADNPLTLGREKATAETDINFVKPGDSIVIYTPVLNSGSGKLEGGDIYIVQEAEAQQWKDGMFYYPISGGALRDMEDTTDRVLVEAPGMNKDMMAEVSLGQASTATSSTSGLIHVEDKEITTNEQVDWRQVLGWKPPIRASFGSNAAAYKWLRKFRLFGHNAPSQYFSVSIDSKKGVVWSQKSYDYYLSSGKTLKLDAVYDDLKENTSFLLVAGLKNSGAVVKKLTITAVEQVKEEVAPSSSAAPTMQATVTQISVNENLPANIDVRSAVLYELDGSEIQFWHKQYPAAYSGNAVYIPLVELVSPAGVAYTGVAAAKLFEAGRRMILADGVATPQAAAVSAVQAEGDHLKITLDSAINTALDPTMATAYANVALSTHGETIASEALGSGDASKSFQSFALKKSPVTFVPKVGAKNGAASTLTVSVAGITWQEVDTLYGQEEKARVYTTRINDDDEMTVQFGDGQTGSRLPSCKSNLLATYRQGIGKCGNLAADSLTVPLDKPPGVKEVTNPLPSAGGADPEELSAARQNAPNAVRTLGRIVSLRDFEDAAREYAGIAKARAVWQWDGMERAVTLTVAGDDGAAVPPGSTTHSDLVADLNSRRDPHRKLTVDSYLPVPVQVTAAIQTAADQDSATIQAQALAALTQYFDFDSLELGQPIHLSSVMSVLQGVSGVEAVDVDRLQFKTLADRSSHSASADAVQAHLDIFPNELATIEAPASDLIIKIGLSQV